MKPLKAIAYLRASTKAQDESVSQQRRAIEKYATEANIVIVETFCDDGVSGTHDWTFEQERDGLESKRPAFKAMIQACETRTDFRLIIVYSISRWGRFLNTSDSLYWRRRVERTGKQFASVIDPELEGLAGEIMQLIGAHQAGEENRQRSITVRRGMRAAVEQGKWVGGRAPYGFKVENHRLVPGDPEQIKTIKWIHELRALRQTLRDIAATLNMNNIDSPKGDSFWNAMQIRRILNNPVYRGELVWNDKGGKYTDEKETVRVKLESCLVETSI